MFASKLVKITADPKVVCIAGRQPMCLADKLEHFEKCRHPQCVALLARYEQIAKFVEENWNNPNYK